MTNRALTVLLLLGLAACAPAGEATAPDPAPPSPTTATTDHPEPAALLQYDFPAGHEAVYDVTVTQNIAFEARGDAPGLGDESLPIDADLVTESTGQAVHAFSPGSRPDAVDMRISARFPDTRVSGTVNRRIVDSLEEGGLESELARIDPVDVLLTVSPSGKVLARSDGDERVVGAGLAALTGLTNDVFARPVGPAFPTNRELAIGDTWESVEERPGQSGPVIVRATSEIVDVIDGRYLIHTVTTTDAYTVDFSDEFRQLYLRFAEVAEGDEVPAELQERLDAIEFSITVHESTIRDETEFDAVTGTVVTSGQRVRLKLSMTFRSPDESSGDITGFDITLDISQAAMFRLVP